MTNDDINYASIKIKCVLVIREKTKQKKCQMTLRCRWWEPGTLAVLKKNKIGSYVFIFLGKVLWGPTQEDSFPGGSSVKNSTATQVMCVQSLGQEAPLEKGNGNPLQYSCQENFIDRGAWRATVHGIAKSQT